MIKFTFRNLFVIAIILHVSVASQAQVHVEKSKDRVIISGKPYYIHIVRKGETSYSISKAYNMTVDELVRENPQASKGIKDGQALRLPIKDETRSPDDEKTGPKVDNEKADSKDSRRFIYHVMSKGETVYSLSKRYSVTETEILQSNPGVDIHKLPVGTEIAIPRVTERVTGNPAPQGNKEDNKVAEIRQVEQGKTDAGQDQQKAFLMHTVVKGETLATIADKYGVTVRDIRKENKGLVFPKVNEIIRIPVERVTEYQAPLQVLSDTARVEVNEVTDDEPVAVETTEVRSLKGDFRIALLLPLYYNENSERIEIDSSQIIKGKRIRKVINRDDKWIYPGTMPFLELYQGVLIAADTLRSLGLDIDIHVYDIRGDTLGLTRLIESGDLRDMDLIVGPVYSRNLSIMAAYADRLGIPVVTPVPLRNNDVLTGHSSVFITNPTLEVAQRAIADRVSVIDSSNFIFIHADSANYDDDVNGFRSLLLDKLSAKYGNDQPRFRELVFYSRSTVSRDSIRRLERLMMPGYNNVVLIASEEPPVLSESVMDIHTLSKKYKVSLVGYPAMRDLENLDPKFYFDLGLELFSPYWIDYTSDDVVRFNRIYRQKFFTEPQESSFAWQGYDLTYYFISGLAMHGKKFLNRPEIHNPDLLSTAFRFIRHDRGDGFENQMLYLLKFSGEMELKKEGESWERSGK